jgi:hypothetical protein
MPRFCAAGVDPVHHVVEQPGIEHLVDRLASRAGWPNVGLRAERVLPLLIVGHGHVCTPSVRRILLHKPSDTPSASMRHLPHVRARP